ncbi:unnamed protein product, partial [marine sediment metagenome]
PQYQQYGITPPEKGTVPTTELAKDFETQKQLKTDVLSAETIEFPKKTGESDVEYVGRFKAKKELLETRRNVINEAQRDYYPEIQEIGKLGKGQDPEEWFGQLRAKREEKTIQAELIKEETEKKELTKWRDESVKLGIYDDVIARYGENIPEEKWMGIVSKIKSIPKGYEDVGGQIKALTGIETFKKAMASIKDKTPEHIDKEIKQKQSALDKAKQKGLFGADWLKKDRIPKKEQERLASEIESLKEYKKILEDILGGLETEKAEYTEQQEAAINRVIQANAGATREEVIDALKKAGKL